jgi:hypothetical protein
VVERIYPKTTSGFDETVKTDVLAIRVSRTDLRMIDDAMTRVLSPRAEGKFYVSFVGLEEAAKRTTFLHQNWYLEQVKVVKVSGFNNIDRKYDIGMNCTWSFRDFMKGQPGKERTVPMDVDNGGFKTRGTKIMVMPKYIQEAKELYEEFRSLMQQTENRWEDEQDAMDDDETTINSNVKCNSEQLKAMFESSDFPKLEKGDQDPDQRNQRVHNKRDQSGGGHKSNLKESKLIRFERANTTEQ